MHCKRSEEETELHKPLVIIFIGVAAGKDQYTIVDSDIAVAVRQFYFDVHLEIDNNGDGALVVTDIYPRSKPNDPTLTISLQNFIWTKLFGSIPSGRAVVHVNGNTMDNRACNLMLLAKEDVDSHYKGLAKMECLKESVYWKMINTLAPKTKLKSRQNAYKQDYYSIDGERIRSNQILWNLFYECHLTSCVKMEPSPCTFKICSRCKQVRYCGVECQHNDWNIHKMFCQKAVVEEETAEK